MVKLSLRRISLCIYWTITMLGFIWLWYMHYSPLELLVWEATFIFACMAIAFHIYFIHLPWGEGLSLTSAFLFASTVTMGINSVFIIVLLIILFNLLIQPRLWYINLFNGAQYGLSAYFGLMAFLAAGGSVGQHFTFFNFTPYLVFMLVYYFFNLFFISTFIMIREESNVLQIIAGFVDKEVLLSYFMMMGFGIIAVIVFQGTGVSGILFFGLILGILTSIFRHYFDIYTHFKSLSIRDELTGVYNHREFQTKLSQLVGNGTSFSLLFLDVDYFKMYNDTLGHPQGDQLLKNLADLMESAITSVDGWLFRYGGEEFATILPAMSSSDAEDFSIELCRTIANTEFIGTECMPGNHITVSIGVSSFPHMTQNRNHIIAYADEALYKAKNLGRNRVEVYKSYLLSLVPELLEQQDADIEGLQELVANLRDVDHYTYRHSERVLQYAVSLAEHVGVSQENMVYLKCAALLHDVGKCEVPRYILTKPGRITEDEWVLVKKHPVVGEQMMARMLRSPLCCEIIRHHHERYDGGGYPDGLKGEDIPYLARLLTIVDSFDAMTSSRPYQPKRSVQEAIDELKRCSGSQFDPQLTKEFVEIVLNLKVKAFHIGA